MSVYGDYLMIAAGGYKDSANPRASIYNIKDPTDVKLAYAFNDTLPSYDIKISGKKLFVAFEAQGTDVGGIKVFENQFSPVRHLFVSPDGNDTSGMDLITSRTKLFNMQLINCQIMVVLFQFLLVLMLIIMALMLNNPFMILRRI